MRIVRGLGRVLVRGEDSIEWEKERVESLCVCVGDKEMERQNSQLQSKLGVLSTTKPQISGTKELQNLRLVVKERSCHSDNLRVMYSQFVCTRTSVLKTLKLVVLQH